MPASKSRKQLGMRGTINTARRRIRHLPVVDGERTVGIISIGDLVKARIDGIEAEAEAMRLYIQAG